MKNLPPDVLTGPEVLTRVGLQQNLRLPDQPVGAGLRGVGSDQELLQDGVQVCPVRLAQSLPGVLSERTPSSSGSWTGGDVILPLFTWTARVMT